MVGIRKLIVAVLILILVSAAFYKVGQKGAESEKCEPPNCFKINSELDYYVSEDEDSTYTTVDFKQAEFLSYIRKEGNYFSIETRDKKGRIGYEVTVDLRSNKTEVVIRNLSCYGLSENSEWTWANCRTVWNANLTKETTERSLR